MARVGNNNKDFVNIFRYALFTHFERQNKFSKICEKICSHHRKVRKKLCQLIFFLLLCKLHHQKKSAISSTDVLQIALFAHFQLNTLNKHKFSFFQATPIIFKSGRQNEGKRMFPNEISKNRSKSEFFFVLSLLLNTLGVA